MPHDWTPGAQALLDTLPCGHMQTSRDGKVLHVNQTFCRWVGYASEELAGRRFQDLLSMGGRIFHQTHWAPLLQMQGSISEVKLDLVHRDGTRIPMVINAIRLVEGDVETHEIAAYVARDRDAYERELLMSRKRLETLVEEAVRLEAEAKDRAVFAEQMIGIVSHDLRNPLSAIGLGAALLSRECSTSSQERTLARIHRALERANRLIMDLLDFTRARVGRGLAVERGDVDLHEAVSRAVDELSDVYPGRSILHVRHGDGACAADGNRIAQLVANLVSNAVVYGSADSPVTVTSAVVDDACSISVHNTGAPIAPELQARIFEPMTRATRHGDAQRSVGLGLFIVSEIAKAHGGVAHVTSSERTGTEFTVTFPRCSTV